MSRCGLTPNQPLQQTGAAVRLSEVFRRPAAPAAERGVRHSVLDCSLGVTSRAAATFGVGMFVIEDERHAEPQARFASFQQAVAELKRRAKIPWDQDPNRAPCRGWQRCGRTYEVIEYDDSQVPWEELRRVTVLDVSAAGVEWSSGFGESE